MENKTALLEALRAGLASKTITTKDVLDIVRTSSVQSPVAITHRLTVVDAMFYVAGIILYAAIASVIAQTWNNGSLVQHLVLSLAIGVGLWAYAYYLHKRFSRTDSQRAFTNAMLLTGSLLIITAGYVINSEIIGHGSNFNFVSAAIILALIGSIHIAFDQIIKKPLLTLIGILLSVAAVPTVIINTLYAIDTPPPSLVAFVLIASAGLLLFATRTITAHSQHNRGLGKAFDVPAVFASLLVMYTVSFSDAGQIWLSLMIISVIGLFYLSIIKQNRSLLGSASLFLVISIITIAFKYFSGYGAAVSLAIAAVGLLGTAAAAASINKQYFTKEEVIV